MELNGNVSITIRNENLTLLFLNQILNVSLTATVYGQRSITYVGNNSDLTWITCTIPLCSGYFSFDGKQYYSLSNNGRDHFGSASDKITPHSKAERDKLLIPKFERKLYIEYAVIIDHFLIKKYDNNTELIKKDVLKTMFMAKNILYDPFKIELVLVELIYWNSDVINVTRNMTKDVARLFQWINNNKFSTGYDVIHLYTGIDTYYGAGMVAYIGNVCRSTATAIIKYYEFTKKSQAVIIAHEIAHSLDIRHDSFENGCNKKDCMMASVSDRDNPQKCWSICSKRMMIDFLSRGGGQCLQNAPLTSKSIHVCRNGILEYGEDCHCNGNKCEFHD